MPGPPASSNPTPPATSAPEEPRVRVDACGPADRGEQTRLHNQCFKKPVEVESLIWRYDDNPCGQALSFLSRPQEAEGVAGYACSPRLAVTRGRACALVGETGDVMTHPDWRKRGLFSALDRAAREEADRRGWPLMFGFPNRHSAHIFVELGWEPIGTVSPWSFLLRDHARVREERSKEGRLAAWRVGFDVARGRRTRRRMARSARGYSARPMERIPEEVEMLSRSVEARFDFMVRRDARSLQWRFLASPSGLHRVLRIDDARGAFCGYVVVQLPRESQGVGYLVDLLAGDGGALPACLAAGLDALDQAGCSLVQATAIDGSWWSGVLRDWGFLPARRERSLSIILHPLQAEHPLVRAARHTPGWYFTDGDRDDETMG
jgi:GNAT superfamily N-acetyltransferase